MSAYSLFVGIDIASKSVSVAETTSPDQAQPAYIVPQTEAGREELKERLLKASGNTPSKTLIVMEATSTYWMELALDLHQAGFAVSVINPAQAYHFAQALLRRAKTDAIDAQTLARLAATFKPERWSPPPAVYEELRQRLTQRDDLLSMRQQIRNQHHARRRRAHVIEAVEERTQQLLDLLEQQIAELDREIADIMSQDDAAWADAAQRLMSIVGVGRVTAGWLLVTILNFTMADTPQQVASFAGLVPHKRESGTSVRRRSSIGHAGNGRLRTALYMAALSAVQHNPIIRRFYYRLLERGKHRKVALCAAAHKLVHIAWAVVTKQQVFNPDYQQQTALAVPAP